MHRLRPGAEFGGTEKNFADQDFLGKNYIFTAKISDDLFLVIDHDFPIFPIFFKIVFPYLNLLPVMSYMTLSSQEKPLFQKIIP